MSVYLPSYRNAKNELVRSSVWWLKYRSATHHLMRESSKTRDEAEARALLAERIREATVSRQRCTGMRPERRRDSVVRLFTTKEIAQRCRVSYWTVRGWIDAGLLPTVRIPGSRLVRVQASDVAQLLSDSRMTVDA